MIFFDLSKILFDIRGWKTQVLLGKERWGDYESSEERSGGSPERSEFVEAGEVASLSQWGAARKGEWEALKVRLLPRDQRRAPCLGTARDGCEGTGVIL